MKYFFRKKNILSIFVFLTSTIAIFFLTFSLTNSRTETISRASSSVDIQEKGCLPTEQRDILHNIWENNNLAGRTISNLMSTDDIPKVLYETQGLLQNLLRYAYYGENYEILDELAGLIRKIHEFSFSYDPLKEEYYNKLDSYVYYSPNIGGTCYPGYTKIKLQEPKVFWISEKDGRENILDSSKFLYMVSRWFPARLIILSKFQMTKELKI